jgi:uncharacterized damage-inducible protein DinB
MDIKQGLINELQMEAANTRKMLEIVPADKFDWKPHEKSMLLRRLAVHVAELSIWPVMVVNDDELDLEKMDYKPTPVTSTQDLLDVHEKAVEKSVAAIKDMPEEDLMKPWTLRKGEQIIFQLPKIAVLRGMCYNHLYHHRGQLSVFLRLLDIKIPGMYGPSADEA